MLSKELNIQYQRLITLIDNTKLSCGDNIELQGHWGKYLCVLTSGFLENAICQVYVGLVSNSASPAIANFTIGTLSKIQNPKTNKFIEVARSFKKEWGDDLEKYITEDESRKDAINSIMTNRHLVAHGKNTSISVVKTKEYLEKCVEVINFIEHQCGYTQSYP